MKKYFLEYLKNQSTPEASIIDGFFSFIDDEEFDQLLTRVESLYEGTDSYFGESSKDCWFEIFHKTIRQTNFYTNLFKKVKHKLLTEDEYRERRKLRYDFIKEEFEKTTDAKEGELFGPKYSRLLELSRRIEREDLEKPINGWMDSMLWDFIHVDKKNTLYNAFVYAFETKKLEAKLK